MVNSHGPQASSCSRFWCCKQSRQRMANPWAIVSAKSGAVWARAAGHQGRGAVMRERASRKVFLTVTDEKVVNVIIKTHIVYDMEIHMIWNRSHTCWWKIPTLFIMKTNTHLLWTHIINFYETNQTCLMNCTPRYFLEGCGVPGGLSPSILPVDCENNESARMDDVDPGGNSPVTNLFSQFLRTIKQIIQCYKTLHKLIHLCMGNTCYKTKHTLLCNHHTFFMKQIMQV